MLSEWIVTVLSVTSRPHGILTFNPSMTSCIGFQVTCSRCLLLWLNDLFYALGWILTFFLMNLMLQLAKMTQNTVLTSTILNLWLEIHGKDQNGVSSAHTRISVLIENARRRQPFTHFISFPMVSEVIQAKFDEFKEDVLRFCEGVG